MTLDPGTTFGVVMAFLLAFGGAARWFWLETRKAQKEDNDFRASQDAKRDTATREINQSWIDAVKEMDVRREKTDLAHTAAIERIGAKLEAHDDQAKEIKQIVTEIHTNTRPGGNKPNGGRM